LAAVSEALLPVAIAVAAEEESRSHTLRHAWDAHVQHSLEAAGSRRLLTLRRLVERGAFLAYHYYRNVYQYSDFLSIFSRREEHKVGGAGSEGQRSSSGGVALKRHGGAIMIQSSELFLGDSTTVANGMAYWGNGGGVKCFSSALRLDSGAAVRSSQAQKGGGIHAEECSVVLAGANPSVRLENNRAFLDGGALYLGEFARADIADAEMRANTAACPVREETKSCPDWHDTITDDGVDSFCILPSCKGYLGRGGAAFLDTTGRFNARRTAFVNNSATGGGGAIFVVDSLDFVVSEQSSFVDNVCPSPRTGSGVASGGGAIFMTLSAYKVLDPQPVVSESEFRDNVVEDGTGGAIFWTVPPNMFAQVSAKGGLLRLDGSYKATHASLASTPPLASGNTAAWGGNFIASGPFALVVIQGPARENGVGSSSTSVSCDGFHETGLCPKACSGAVAGQQCVARASTSSKARSVRARGGVPITSATGGDEMKVAVVDFYNHVVESATHPVLVEAAVDYVDSGLGMAYRSPIDVDGNGFVDADEEVTGLTNCSAAKPYWAAVTRKRPRVCAFKLSPQTVTVGGEQGGSQVSAIPDRGIASFPGLAVHGPPSNVCFRDEALDMTVCSPHFYDLVVTSVGAVGPDRRGIPRTAVTLEDCPPGTWLDRRKESMRCTQCVPGRYTDGVNTNLDGSTQHDPCKVCGKGQYQSQTGATRCASCAVGTFADVPESHKCKICKNGTHTAGASGAHVCVSCPAGKFGDIVGAVGSKRAVCLHCKPGRFQRDSYKKWFDDYNHYKEAESNQSASAGNVSTNEPVTPLPAEPPVSWDCAYCPMGWKQPRTGEAKCQNCRAGMVSEDGATMCTIKCLEGTYRKRKQYQDQGAMLDSGEIATPEGLCVGCPHGYVAPNLATLECDACTPGSHMDEIGKVECKHCPRGYLMPDKNATVCQRCAAGFYQIKLGQTACTKCEIGRFSEPDPDVAKFVRKEGGGGWLTNPTSAQDGANKINQNNYFWDEVLPAAGSGALPLQPGELRRKKGTHRGPIGDPVEVLDVYLLSDRPPKDPTSCAQCPPGKWTGLNGVPENEASTHCDTCPTGWKYTSEVDVENSNTAHQSYSTCEKCPRNEITNQTGATQCMACPDNSWTKLVVGGSECTACVQGEVFTGSNDKNCDTCEAVNTEVIGDRGRYSFVAGGEQCHACAPGRWCHGGAEMSTEWGWWEADGLGDHEDQLRSIYKAEAEKGKRPLNSEQCSSLYSGLSANQANATFDPKQCNAKCDKETDPDCQCRRNNDNVEECRLWCDALDDTRGGIYMDACGLPKKVTRCPGFQQLISCEQEFRKQWQQLHDPDHSRNRIYIQPQCQACRGNMVVGVEANVTARMTFESFTYRQVAHAHVPAHMVPWAAQKTVNDSAIAADGTVPVAVDVMWAYDGNTGPDVVWPFDSPYNTVEVLDKGHDHADNDVWPVTLVSFRMPRAGTWDTKKFAELFGHIAVSVKSKAEAIDEVVETEIVTVGLLSNDPRVELAREQMRKGHVATMAVLARADASPTFDLADNNTLNTSYVGASKCNFMNGYTGRLCRKCLPGFALSKKECVRCPPYGITMGVVMMGVILAFVIVLLVVVAVVHDAGSTSTSTVLKRIALNHAQTVGLLMSFDLNWSPNLGQFFRSAQAASSVGDELIQTSCPLAVMHNAGDLPMRPFYVAQVFFLVIPFAFMIPGFIYFVLLEYACGHAKAHKEEAFNKENETSQRALADLKAIRSRQDKLRSTPEGRAQLEEAKALRTEYNELLAQLHAAGVDDVGSASRVLADHHAIGRLRARDFVSHCARKHVHLQDLFAEFDKDHTGSIKISDFFIIVESQGIRWSDEEKLCVAELFAGDHDDDPETEDEVPLTRLMSFGKSLCDRVTVMVTVVCFLLYPTITRKVFQSLSCEGGLYDGFSRFYLKDDMEVSCTSAEHISYILFVGVPVLVGFVIGFPAFSLLAVWRSAKKHGWMDEKTMYRYAVLISGYKPTHWYWEGVVCARKVLLTLFAVFLGIAGPEIQFFFASLLLVSSAVLHVHCKPFSNRQLNQVETAGLLILFISLYNGMFFFWNLLDEEGLNILGLCTIGLNLFYLLWVFGAVFSDWLHRDPLGKKLVGRCYNVTNPFLLALLVVPYFFILLGIFVYHMVTCAPCHHARDHKKHEADGHRAVEMPTDLLRKQNLALREAVGATLKEVDCPEARARRAARAMNRKKTQGVFQNLIKSKQNAEGGAGGSKQGENLANWGQKTDTPLTQILPVDAGADAAASGDDNALAGLLVDDAESRLEARRTDASDMALQDWDENRDENKNEVYEL
jgi:predicted outer membrane repeat protein